MNINYLRVKTLYNIQPSPEIDREEVENISFLRNISIFYLTYFGELIIV